MILSGDACTFEFSLPTFLHNHAWRWVTYSLEHPPIQLCFFPFLLPCFFLPTSFVQYNFILVFSQLSCSFRTHSTHKPNQYFNSPCDSPKESSYNFGLIDSTERELWSYLFHLWILLSMRTLFLITKQSMSLYNQHHWLLLCLLIIYLWQLHSSSTWVLATFQLVFI